MEPRPPRLTGIFAYVRLIAAGALIAAIALLPSRLFANSLQAPATYSDPAIIAQDMVAADLNGDGVPDIVLCGVSGPAQVFFGQSNGTFANGPTLPYTCTFSGGIVAADFNGDGAVDLAISDASQVNVLLNNGSGSFSLKQILSSSVSLNRMVVGDFNGDGIVDLAVNGTGATPGLHTFLGNGDGTFGAEIVTSNVCDNGGVAADLNGDSKQDVIVVCSGIMVLLSNGDGTFAPQVNYPAANNTSAIAVGDFNHDGKIDIASVGNNVAVDLGNGDGTFQAPIFTFGNTNFGGGYIKTLDFDGDGIPDLVFSNPNSNYIGILHGRGDGTFIVRPGIFFTTAVSPTGLAVFDVNHDGVPDIATWLGGGGTLNVFLGTSATPLFQNPLPATNGANSADWVALGDLNHDGKLDAVGVGISQGLLTGYLGDGTGFLPSPHVPQNTGSSPNSVALADFNHDGKLDAVVANGSGASGSLGFFLGNGDGTFQPQTTFTNNMTRPEEVVVADFNGDGNPDAALVDDLRSKVNVWLGDGTGNFTVQPQLVNAGNPDGLVVGDFNQDGKLDIATANSGDGTVSVYMGNRDGTFQPAQTYATNFLQNLGFNYITAGDFNGDGITDLAVSNDSDAAISILIGKPGGTFNTGVRIPAPGGPFGIRTGDLNGDGILDLVVSIEATNSVGVFVGKGDGTFQPMQSFSNNNQPADFTTLADVNHDGILDLVVAASTNGIYVLLGNGSFATPIQASYAPEAHYAAGTTPAGLAIADYNHDGKDDVAVANSGSANISVLFGNASGTFGTAANYSTGAGTTPVAIAAGDFDRDGFADLAVTNDNAAANGTVLILPNDKTGKFPSIAHTYTVGMRPRAISAVDVDGDGILDLQVTNGGDGTVSVLFGNGDGSFQTPQTFGMVPKPGVISKAPLPAAATIESLNGMATADLNGDGKPDMVAADATNNAVQVRLNNGNKTFSSAQSYLTGGTQTSSVAIGDVNGDGQPDIVATNFGSSNLTVFTNNGNGTFTKGQTVSVTKAGKGLGPIDIELLDFNNDGRLDIATVNYNDSTVSALVGNGDGTFQAPVTYSVQLNPQAIRQASIGGSRNGLVTSDSGSGLISVLLPAINTSVAGASTANPSTFGTSVTITATVTPAHGSTTPSGMVTFSEDGVTFGTPVAMTAGKASLTTSALAVGPHSILMSYSGDLADNPSSNTVTQVVTKTASSTALVVTGSQTIGATLTLTATVSGAGVTPTGAVTFNDGATTLGTGPLVSGIATFQTNKLALGQHNLTAVYAGSPNYAGSASSTVVVNIQQPVVTVELTASSQELLQGSSDTFTATLKAPSGSPAPTGTITFTDGATTLATKTLPLHTFSTSSLALGEHIIVATYNGNLGSASDSVIVFIYSGTQTITLTTLTSTAVQFANGTFHVPFRMNGSPQTAGSVVFTAFVQGGTTPAITGAVQFYDDDVALGNPVTLDGTQHANLTWNQFALGKHRIFAVYVPDNSTYSGSVSVESPQTDIYRDPTPLNLQH